MFITFHKVAPPPLPNLVLTTAPVVQALLGGQTVGDIANIATLRSTSNYTPAADLVEVLVNGTARTNSHVLAENDAVILRAAKAGYNDYMFTIDTAVGPTPASAVLSAFTVGTQTNGDLAVGYTIDKDSTCYVVILPAGATAPSAAQIVTGTDGAGTAALDSGTVILHVAGTQAVYDITAAIQRSVDIYIVPAGSTSVRSATGITLDSRPAGLSAAAGSITGATTATIAVTSDETGGTMHMGLFAPAVTPTAASVVSGSGAIQHVSVPAATGVNSFDLTGLTASTSYRAYFVQDDAQGNRSLVASTATFTTAGVSNTFTFDGTDGTLITAITENGFSWTRGSGSTGSTSRITGNRLQTFPNSSERCVVTGTNVADVEVSLVLQTAPSSGAVGLLARWNGDDATRTGYFARFNYNNGTFQIYRRNTDASLLLTSANGTLASGDKLSLRCVGSTISLLKNDVVVASATDATHSTGPVGYTHYQADSYIDNFTWGAA